MEEENIITAYKDTLQKRKRAEDDLKTYEDQYVSLITSRVRDEILNGAEGLSEQVESFGLLDEKGRKFQICFTGGVEVKGDQFGASFMIDGETYPALSLFSIQMKQQRGKVYVFKHKLKKVRETVNRLMPFVLYLSKHFDKLDSEKLLKRAQEKLQE